MVAVPAAKKILLWDLEGTAQPRAYYSLAGHHVYERVTACLQLVGTLEVGRALGSH